MRYWFDTEFIEDGKTIDLISIGIAAEDGREYYAVLREFNRVALFSNPWLVENVAPSLPIVKVDERLPLSYANYDEVYTDPAWKRRDEARREIVAFCDPEQYGKPQLWAYYADYDWVALCQLFGRMLDLPAGWPMYCRDLKQLADMLGKPRLPEQGKGEHHALADARWNLETHSFLIGYGQAAGFPETMLAG